MAINFSGIKSDAITINSEGSVMATNIKTGQQEIVCSRSVDIVMNQAEALRKIGQINTAAKKVRNLVQECRDVEEIAIDEFRIRNGL